MVCGHFVQATPAQAQAWPAIKAGRDTLIAAPTGSGKTLAAFLAAIDDFVRQGLASPLADATQVVYVSPLKALSNDIRRNLEAPLAGIPRNCGAAVCPMLRYVPGCAPAIPPRQNVSACAGGHRTFW